MRYNTRNYCDDNEYDEFEETFPTAPSQIKRSKKPIVRGPNGLTDLRTGKSVHQSFIHNHTPQVTPNMTTGELNGLANDNWDACIQPDATQQNIEPVCVERSRDQLLSIVQEIAELTVANSFQA